MEATNQGPESRVFCRKRRNNNNVEANHGVTIQGSGFQVAGREY